MFDYTREHENDFSFWYPKIKDCGIPTPLTFYTKLPSAEEEPEYVERLYEAFYMEHPEEDEEVVKAYLEERVIPKLKERDKRLERLWAEFGDVPMNPETEEIEAPFLCFPAGTNREEVWEWFDERYSRGVAKLLLVGEPKDREVAQALFLTSLCCECDSEHCVFNPDGICKAPFVTGRAPGLNDDGCTDYCYKEAE